MTLTRHGWLLLAAMLVAGGLPGTEENGGSAWDPPFFFPVRLERQQLPF
jgi:hypothetical protein